MVNLEELPQATPAELAAQPRYELDRRPLDNLTDQQYKALKREAAERWPGAHRARQPSLTAKRQTWEPLLALMLNRKTA